jgi:outer membrane protein TolC
MRFGQLLLCPERITGRISILSALALQCFPAPLAAAPAGPEPLTLTQALAVALERSPRLRASGAAVEQARAGVREARSAGLPNANLQVSGAEQGPEAGLRLPNGQTATFQPDQSAQGGISGQVPLDLSSRGRASTRRGPAGSGGSGGSA